ncbi:protein of unknown function [Hyphomicrobium sp. 1Nfss2.1]
MYSTGKPISWLYISTTKFPAVLIRFRSFAWNIRTLGPKDWLRCFVINVGLTVRERLSWLSPRSGSPSAATKPETT